MGHLNGCPRKCNFLIINKLQIRLKLGCQSQERKWLGERGTCCAKVKDTGENLGITRFVALLTLTLGHRKN